MNQRSMDNQNSRTIQRQSAESWTLMIKKYCLLVDSPDKTSTPTVDLPASAHLKKILNDGFSLRISQILTIITRLSLKINQIIIRSSTTRVSAFIYCLMK